MVKERKRLQCVYLAFILAFSIASVFVKPVFATETKFYVDPSSIINPTLTPTKTFTINIIIANVSNMYGYELKLYWDNKLLECTGYTETPPAIWGSNRDPSGPGIEQDFNATHGRFWRAISARSPAVAFTGTVTIYTLSFKVVGIGSSPLTLDSTKIADPYAGMIDHIRENGYFNNISPAMLYVSPSNIVNASLVPCENFTVAIKVLDVINLYSWGIKLYYENYVLNATAVSEGPFLNSSGSTLFEVKELNHAFNATHGLVWLACSLLAPPPVSGNGTLATISFHVEAVSKSPLVLENTTMNDPWSVPIPHSVQDGYFNNIPTHLFVNPPSIINPTMVPPSNFTVDIKVANVTNLYDYQFKLGYNTLMLNCLGAIIIPFNNETNFVTELYLDDEMGFIWVNVTYHPPAEPLTTANPVKLAIIFFQVANRGESILDLYDTRLSDPYDEEIIHYVSDGYVAVIWHDVAVVNVVPPAIVYERWIVDIDVTVANEGDVAETFDVTAYYDNEPIETLPVVDLLAGKNITLVFSWNTSGLPTCHNYTIKAEATIVPDETDTADNVYIDGIVKIKMLGDVNGDGVVDIYDKVLVGSAFGAIYNATDGMYWHGPPDFSGPCSYCPHDPNADLNNDHTIDIYDKVIIGVNFGRTC